MASGTVLIVMSRCMHHMLQTPENIWCVHSKSQATQSKATRCTAVRHLTCLPASGLGCSFVVLPQALEAAKSLEEVTAAHQSFMASVHRQCLLAPDRTWKLIEGAVVSILNEVLYFAELQQQLLNAVSH